MLKHQRTSQQLHRESIPGALPPSVSLLDDLIKLLNETRTEEGKSVMRILEQMLDIEALAKPIEGVVLADMELEATDAPKFNLLCKIDEKIARLQRDLAKFKFVPRADVIVGGSGNASEWATWWGRSGNQEKGEPTLRMRPSEAVELILRITQIGSLGRLRRCANCGKWLYAKFRHQTFCSLSCQQKSYTQSEQWKAHRRVYMRNRYRMLFTKPKKQK
jgi:hypothetical protein